MTNRHKVKAVNGHLVVAKVDQAAEEAEEADQGRSAQLRYRGGQLQGATPAVVFRLKEIEHVLHADDARQVTRLPALLSSYASVTPNEGP